MKPGLSLLLTLLVVPALACEGDPGLSLLLDVRTDLAPGAEFTGIAVLRNGEVVAERNAYRTQDYVAGVRVAELVGLPTQSTQEIVLQLVSPEGVVLERPWLVQLGASSTATVLVLTRDCRGIECPAPDRAEATACLAGRCVDPRCSVETDEFCDVSECRSDSDCPAPAPCARARCDLGVCLYEAADECGDGAYCDPDQGCRPRPFVASMDSGMPVDAGVQDAGPTVDGGEPVDAGPRSDAGCSTQLLSIVSEFDDGEVDGDILDYDGESPGAFPDGVYIGAWSGAPTWGFYRFLLQSAIEAGSTITDARLIFYGLGYTSAWDSGRDSLTVFMEQQADALRVSTYQEAPDSTRPRPVTSSLRWPDTGGLTWPTNDHVTSANLAPLVQEVVDGQSGLNLGAGVQFWLRATEFSSDTEVIVNDVGVDPTYPAQLSITHCPP